jgi:hypothetical protein
MTAYRTLAGCSPLRASEALDAALLTFVLQVVDVLAVFPLGHPLVVVPARGLVAHAVRVADVELANPMLFAKLHNLSCPLVAQVAHLALDAGTDLGSSLL